MTCPLKDKHFDVGPYSLFTKCMRKLLRIFSFLRSNRDEISDVLDVVTSSYQSVREELHEVKTQLSELRGLSWLQSNPPSNHGSHDNSIDD